MANLTSGDILVQPQEAKDNEETLPTEEQDWSTTAISCQTPNKPEGWKEHFRS